MANILINGVNTKSGGGLSILSNYLKLLSIDSNEKGHNYLVLGASNVDLSCYSKDYIRIVNANSLVSSPYLAPFVYEYYLARYIKRNQIDVVFNMGDLIINTTCPQVYLFDWSYAVYPEHPIWKWMDVKSKVNRLVKLYYLKKRLFFKGFLLAQTKVMADKLLAIYGINNVKIVPNAVSIDNHISTLSKDFGLPNGINLLYLTHYYPHKNLEIFLPLAKKIKDQNLDIRIVITIDENQHKKAKELLKNIKTQNLDDIIINVGPVPMSHVPSLYKQCNGLLMPTLLESFSGTYVEAMYHEIPIFTSNIDFAKVVCGDAAFYFDPDNEDSIFDCLIKSFQNESMIKEKVSIGREILASMPDWPKTFSLFQENLFITIEKYCNGQ